MFKKIAQLVGMVIVVATVVAVVADALDAAEKELMKSVLLADALPKFKRQ